MAIGTAAALGIGLGASALGSFMNARQQNKAAQQQTQYNQQQAQQMRQLMQYAPGAAEQQLGGWAQGLQGPGNTLAGTGFNTGQDALMQAMRRDPVAQSNAALQGVIGGQGNPFDTSEMFRALGILDQRATDQAVAQTRAGASGLGARFGSYMARQEGQMRQQAAENAAARNAGIAMQSHGDAQQRLLAAAGQMGQQSLGANQQQIAAMQALQQGGLAAGQLAQQGQLQTQQQQLQALLGAGQMEQGRMGMNAQLAGMAAGTGAPVAGPGYGGVLGGIGQVAMMSQMMQPPPATAQRGVASGYQLPNYVPQVATTPPYLNPMY